MFKGPLGRLGFVLVLLLGAGILLDIYNTGGENIKAAATGLLGAALDAFIGLIKSALDWITGLAGGHSVGVTLPELHQHGQDVVTHVTSGQAA